MCYSQSVSPLTILSHATTLVTQDVSGTATDSGITYTGLLTDAWTGTPINGKTITYTVSNTTIAAGCSATTLAAHGGASAYVGCYNDNWTRDLNGPSYDNGNINTIESCIAFCKGAGFAYAGVQVGSQCFCGSTYGRYGTGNACNFVCSQNHAEQCGGVWANSVYSTASTIPSGTAQCLVTPQWETLSATTYTGSFAGDYQYDAKTSTSNVNVVCDNSDVTITSANSQLWGKITITAKLTDEGVTISGKHIHITINNVNANAPNAYPAGTFVFDGQTDSNGQVQWQPTINWANVYLVTVHHDDDGAFCVSQVTQTLTLNPHHVAITTPAVEGMALKTDSITYTATVSDSDAAGALLDLSVVPGFVTLLSNTPSISPSCPTNAQLSNGVVAPATTATTHASCTVTPLKESHGASTIQATYIATQNYLGAVSATANIKVNCHPLVLTITSPTSQPWGTITIAGVLTDSVYNLPVSRTVVVSMNPTSDVATNSFTFTQSLTTDANTGAYSVTLPVGTPDAYSITVTHTDDDVYCYIQTPGSLAVQTHTTSLVTYPETGTATETNTIKYQATLIDTTVSPNKPIGTKIITILSSNTTAVPNCQDSQVNGTTSVPNSDRTGSDGNAYCSVTPVYETTTTTVTASFAGDYQYNPATSDSQPLTVLCDANAVAITSPDQIWGDVTVSLTLTHNGNPISNKNAVVTIQGTPGPTAHFVSVSSINAGTTDENGVISLTTSITVPGVYTVLAVHNDDQQYCATSAQQPLTVHTHSTALVVTATNGEATDYHAITYTATLTDTSGPVPVPVPGVKPIVLESSSSDDSPSCADANTPSTDATSGVATCSVTPNWSSTPSVTAAFAGDYQYNGAVSASAGFTVFCDPIAIAIVAYTQIWCPVGVSATVT